MWDGNTKFGDIVLATAHSGICTVMGAMRLGMQDAQPYFHDREPGTEWIRGPYARNGLRKPAVECAIYEVCPEATSADDPCVYRRDITGFRSANATFIAHSRQDVDTLLAEVDRLNALIDAQQPLVNYALSAKVMHSPFSGPGVGAHKAHDEYTRRLEAIR